MKKIYSKPEIISYTSVEGASCLLEDSRTGSVSTGGITIGEEGEWGDAKQNNSGWGNSDKNGGGSFWDD